MRNTKKVLVPLATLLAAGTIAVGSGATFSSTTQNTVSAVTSGSLSHTNSKAGAAIFNLNGMKPGDTVNGSLTLTNTGTLPAEFGLTETLSSNGFSGENLKLTIKSPTSATAVYSGTFGGLKDGDKQALGQIAPGASSTYVFTVTLDENTANDNQGKTASASYTWDSVQLSGTTANQ